MVLPSEITHVLHAAPARTLLARECRRTLIIDPGRLLFEGTLQRTVLLMAQKRTNGEDSEGISLVSTPGDKFLAEDPEQFFEGTTYVSAGRGKWSKLFLSPLEREVFEEACSSIRRFGDIASVDLGVLTGANAFFVVDRQTVLRHQLSRFAIPVLAKSERCPGIIYNEALHRENEAKGFPTSLISFGEVPVERLSKESPRVYCLGRGSEDSFTPKMPE